MKKRKLKDIASIAGVSPATISLVLNNRSGVGQEKREYIINLLKENGYSLIKEKALLYIKYRFHGKLVDENQGFIATISQAMEKQCLTRKYRLDTVVCNNLEEKLKKIDFSHYRGLIILGTELQPGPYPFLNQIPVPFVILDNNMPAHNCNCVGINNTDSIYEALSLYDEKELVYLKSSLWTGNFEERALALQKISKESGCRIQTINVEPTLSESYESVRKQIEKIPVPSSVFADNDIIALGAIKAFQDEKRRIPEDCSIIGFDDIALSAISMPSLTTVQIPKEFIGRLTVDTLIKSIENEEYRNVKIQVSGRLMQRNSTLKKGF